MVKENSAKKSLLTRLIKKTGSYKSMTSFTDEIAALRRENIELSLALSRVEDKTLLAEMRNVLPITHEVVVGGELVERALDPREKEAAAITAMATMSATPLSERLTDARHKKIEGNLMRSAEVGMDIEADLIGIIEIANMLLEENPEMEIAKRILFLASRAQQRIKLIYPESDR